MYNRISPPRHPPVLIEDPSGQNSPPQSILDRGHRPKHLAGGQTIDHSDVTRQAITGSGTKAVRMAQNGPAYWAGRKGIRWVQDSAAL